MRLYLDQFAWIRLLQARTRHPQGLPFVDALLLLEEAVRRGEVVLPLSRVHYFETARRQPYAKRKPLASLMAELSQFNTLAPFEALVRAELRVAIARWFESRVEPSPPQPWGRGGDHAFGHGVIAEHVDQLVSKYGNRASPAASVLEWGALARHPDHDIQRGEDPRLQIEAAQRDEAKRLEGLRTLRRSGGWGRGERAKRVWSATAYVEQIDEFNEAFEEAGIPAGRLMAQGSEAMTRFLRDVPTLHAHYGLGRMKEQADSRKWTMNDLRDIDALSGSIVYADAVVTEKTWTALADRAELPQLHGTVVLSDLRRVSELILCGAR